MIGHEKKQIYDRDLYFLNVKFDLIWFKIELISIVCAFIVIKIQNLNWTGKSAITSGVQKNKFFFSKSKVAFCFIFVFFCFFCF